jgi:hypothetical protein
MHSKPSSERREVSVFCNVSLLPTVQRDHHLPSREQTFAPSKIFLSLLISRYTPDSSDRCRHPQRGGKFVSREGREWQVDRSFAKYSTGKKWGNFDFPEEVLRSCKGIPHQAFRKMQKGRLPKAPLEISQPSARTTCATRPSLDSPLGFGFE